MRIALICPVFWPHGKVGAHRATAWARRWAAAHGDQVEVLTRRYPNMEVAVDRRRGEGLSPNIDVRHLTCTDSTSVRTLRLNRLKLMVARAVMVPDVSRRSWERLTDDIAKYLNQFSPDLIVSTSPPHSIHLVAGSLAEAMGVPWIADFRDAYLGDPISGAVGTRRLRKLRHTAAEREIYGRASIIVHTHELHDAIQRQRYPRLAGKFLQVPNGVSEAFLEALGPLNRPIVTSRIVVVGSCGRLELKALVEAVVARPDLELHYAGLDVATNSEIAASCERIHVHGLLSETSVASLIGTADILAIPQHKNRVNRLSSTSRIPEFMAAGRPILIANAQGNDVMLLERFYDGSFLIVDKANLAQSWAEAIHATQVGSVIERDATSIHLLRHEFSRERQADRVRNAALAHVSR